MNAQLDTSEHKEDGQVYRKIFDVSELVTGKDLQISLFKFAKEYKLEWMNIKLNFILVVLFGMIGWLGYMYIYMHSMFLEILQKLPK